MVRRTKGELGQETMMMRKAAVRLIALLILAQGAFAQDALTPPPGSNLALEASAYGVQVYVCTAKDNGFAWVLDGPSAALFDAKGRQIGSHEKGPIWTLGDGSGVTGEVVTKADAPQAGDIPWLLLKVKEHVGGFGKLSNVSYIRRMLTKGGAAPADGCDMARAGDTARVQYSAVYQFFGP